MLQKQRGATTLWGPYDTSCLDETQTIELGELIGAGDFDRPRYQPMSIEGAIHKIKKIAVVCCQMGKLGFHRYVKNCGSMGATSANEPVCTKMPETPVLNAVTTIARKPTAPKITPCVRSAFAPRKYHHAMRAIRIIARMAKAPYCAVRMGLAAAGFPGIREARPATSLLIR